MRKAVLKRIKITGTGKLLRRHQGGNHFNAKQSRRIQNSHKKMTAFSGTMEKRMRAYINN